VTITNRENDKGSCKIFIDGPFDLTHKRGVGLSITGDGKGEEVIVHLEEGVKADGWGYRDFNVTVDFTEKRDLILGDPSTVSDTHGWDYDPTRKHWDHDYKNIKAVAVYIAVAPNSTRSLQLHSLKGLQEKGASVLVNPSITVNGETIIFPESLRVDDASPHIIEYNGYTGQYKVYNSRYVLLSTADITADNITISQGLNDIEINSDTSNAEYSTRADVRISVYDDEDNDGIPTNGDYSEDYAPRLRSRVNFYDDNCPNVYNPKQRRRRCRKHSRP
jgi:hypothetical protein